MRLLGEMLACGHVRFARIAAGIQVYSTHTEIAVHNETGFSPPSGEDGNGAAKTAEYLGQMTGQTVDDMAKAAEGA